jgi:hypothetical protein
MRPVRIPRRPLARPAVWAALAVVAVAVVGRYLMRYPFHNLNPVGWDIHAYVWETKTIGHGPLSDVGARPGFPLVASLLRSLVPIDSAREIVVLPTILVLALGLACGAVTRLAFRLPAWTVPVITLAVGFWPTVYRVVLSYEASLMLFVLLVAGVGVLVHAQGRPITFAVAVWLFTAACLSHVVFYAAFMGVAALAAVLALPAYFRDRRAGRSPLATEAGASIAVVCGGLLGASALFGWLGLNPSESADTQTVSFAYRSRTRAALREIHPRILLPVELVGAALVRFTGGFRPAVAMLRLAASWLIVVGAGVVLSLRGYRVPGARFLQFGIPIPVMFGLAAAAAGIVILRRKGAIRSLLAGVAVLAVVGAILLPHARSVLHNETVLARANPVWRELDAAAVYLGRLAGTPPVVFVVNEPDGPGAYTPKLKYYVMRSEVPADYVRRTFVYVGELANLEDGRPTFVVGTLRWQKDYNAISLRTWKQVDPALKQGAIVLIAQHYADSAFAEAMSQDPSRQVAPGLYVVRGPILTIGSPPPQEPFDMVRGALSAAALFGLLTLVGWGWTRLALNDAGASALDVVSLAPAVGAGACVPSAFVLAALGGDPSGPIGIVLIAVLAVGGAALALRLGRQSAAPPVEGKTR